MIIFSIMLIHRDCIHYIYFLNAFQSYRDVDYTLFYALTLIAL